MSVQDLDRMKHGAFTLVEILIAIVIVVSLCAVVVPLSTSLSERARFAQAQGQVEAMLTQARTESRRLGVAVQVFATPGQDGTFQLEAAAVRPGDRPRDEAVSPRTFDDGTMTVRGGAENDATRSSVSTEPVALPAGVLVSCERSTDGSGMLANDQNVSAADAQLAEDFAQGRIVIAVFLPDGGAIQGAPSYLVGRDGRAAELKVNRWTGSPSVGPVGEARAKNGGRAREGSGG
ncbi:MAG: type II secretion system protein [Phycisphaerae bacterium]|nr:type II secretion system protein [Phycisphaerae bacterium]